MAIEPEKPQTAARPIPDERPIAAERPVADKAGSGSFMPPVRELKKAGRCEEDEEKTSKEASLAEEQPADQPEVMTEVDDEESAEPVELADEEEVAEDDLDDVDAIMRCELLSSGFERAADATSERLDAGAIETSLTSEMEGIEEPRGHEGERARLARVAQLAGARRRAAQHAIDGENAEVDLEEEAIGQRGAGHRQEGTNALEGKRKKRAADAHSAHAGSTLARTATRDELKTQLLTAQAEQKSEAAETLNAKKVELETRLSGQLAGLMEEQKAQDAAIVLEFVRQNGELATRIEEKRKAHDEQIAREKVALELQAETEKITARADADEQADDIVASADAQAAYTLSEAQIHAGNVESKASDEAGAALRAGEAKAQQAIDAAAERAASAAADESEESSIRDEGERRADQARGQATWRAAQIKLTGITEAVGIRDKGKSDSAAEKERGQSESAAALERGESAIERIEDELAASIATMELQSKLAVAEMENERALAMGELEQKRALALTQMAIELTLAAVKIEQERTGAVTALESEHVTLVAAIDRTVEADLKKVDAASDKELARLQRRIDRDLATIERQVKQAERKMQAAVDRAESKAMADVARRRVAIRKAGRDVLEAIDGVVTEAARAIDQADEDTSQEISDAAVIGVQSIAAEAAEARDDNRTASETAIREQEAAAQVSRNETSDLANDASQEMEDDRKALDGDIDQQWVDDAMARSGELLSTDGLDWAVTDGDSVEAMHVMASLPPHLQGQVIDGLSDAELETLLSEMDEERHEHLESLVDASTDPERKLELWQHYQRSKAMQDATRNGDAFSFLIAGQTAVEVGEEAALLDGKKQDGTLTYDDVKELVARKRLENQIEMEYGINVTNEKDNPNTADDERFRALGPNAGTRIAWSESELLELQAVLEELPDAHVQDNDSLREFRREDVKIDRSGTPQPSTGGSHSKGVVRIFDKGVDPNATFRHSGDVREGVDPNGNPIGANLGTLEVVVAHELGHNVHDQNPLAWAAFQAAAGWDTDLDESALIAGGVLSPQQIAQMKSNQQTYQVGDKEYGYRYGELNAFDTDRLPTTGHDPANPGAARDTWWYARDNYKDHFAETYMKAVLVPEQLAVDMLDEPESRLAGEVVQRDMAAAARDTAKANLAALHATSPPPPMQDLLAGYTEWNYREAELATWEQDVAEAKESRDSMALQYDIMRDGIFHTSQAVAAAQADMEAAGVEEAQVADFLDKASRLATPDQVEGLKKSYV
ncbi:MAG TPA: hypothetical protein VIG06_24745 [Kofleriaceae bacterium]